MPVFVITQVLSLVLPHIFDSNKAKMMSFKFLIFVLLYVSTTVIRVKSNCTDIENRPVIIRNPKSFLVVEGHWSDSTIRVRSFRNTTDQYWRLEPSRRIGLFNIINVANGAALDLGTYDQETDSFAAVNNDLVDTISQQWFVQADGTLVNGGAINHVLDIKDGDYVEENTMVIIPREYAGNDSSKYILEFEGDIDI